ncbi:Bis-triphosphatase [Xylariales sp. AK1849]|nr:Bis-triphosphatase [Xylariales sp. AK1849]
MSSRSQGPIQFGPFEVTKQVFLRTPHSFALVNIKPLLPGHVLICPIKSHKRLTDLSAPELTDLFQAVQRVQQMLAKHYFTSAADRSSSSTEQEPRVGGKAVHAAATPEAGSFNIAIQDGSEAGQTVPHLHVHVIPRIRGETEKTEGPGDQIYELMAAEDGNIGGALFDQQRPTPGGGFPRIEDSDRKPRSVEEMETEAETFRGVLGELAGDEAER